MNVTKCAMIENSGVCCERCYGENSNVMASIDSYQRFLLSLSAGQSSIIVAMCTPCVRNEIQIVVEHILLLFRKGT